MTTTTATVDPMKFTVTVKTFFGGFKPLLKEEFADVAQAVECAVKNCDGKRHSMITTFQEGMRDMEFLFLFQKSSNEFTIRTNGKHIDNKMQADVLDTVQGHLGTLLKPLPEIIIMSPEDMQKRWEEHDKAHAKPEDAKPEDTADDRPKEDN